MKGVFVLFVGLLLSMRSYGEAGFVAGSEYETLYLQGRVQVQCWDNANRGMSWRTINCADRYLEPAEFSRFKVDEDVDADQVVLKATHENGKQRKKKSAFSRETKMSKKAFNLGVSTLFQRPLLGMGTTTVEYTLLKNKNSVETGTFQVQVSQGESRRCPWRTIYRPGYGYCRQNLSLVCEQYYRDNNYCKR